MMVSTQPFAVSGNVQRRQMSRAQQAASEQQQQQAAMPPPPPPPAAPAPAPAAGTDDMIAQIQKLGQLHQQGILSDEEFAAQKAKLLA